MNSTMANRTSIKSETSSRDWALLLGRLLMVGLFIMSALGKMSAYDKVAQGMAGKGIPMVSIALPLTIAMELGCAIAIAIGLWTRSAAFVLLLWMIPVTYVYHAWWGLEATQQAAQRTQFLKNTSICTGLLYIVILGAGAISIDAWLRRKRARN